jgi:flagellar protein FliJ
MSKFTFRLESVLSWRKNLEKQAQRDLYTVRNAHMVKERTIQAMKTKREELCRARGLRESQGMDVSLYRIYRSYLDQMDCDIDQSHNELARIEEDIRMRRSALKSASIQKRTLETFKADQRKRHLEHDEKEKQKALDELVIMRRGHTI